MPIRFFYTTTLAALILCLPGCSLLIAHSGTSLRDLDSREIVHDKFGPPDTVSVVDLIDPRNEEIRQFEVERYHVHAKFRTGPPCGAGGFGMLLLDPFLTIGALSDAAVEIAEGHHLAFVYDGQGKTIGSDYPRPFLDPVQFPFEINVLDWEEATTSGAPRGLQRAEGAKGQGDRSL